MTRHARPAAYLRIADPVGHRAVTEAARQRGWPDPVLYTETQRDTPGSGTVLDRLVGAVAAGQHNAVLISGQFAGPEPLAPLLRACADHGVPVITAFAGPRPAGHSPAVPTLRELLASNFAALRADT